MTSVPSEQDLFGVLFSRRSTEVRIFLQTIDQDFEVWQYFKHRFIHYYYQCRLTSIIRMLQLLMGCHKINVTSTLYLNFYHATNVIIKYGYKIIKCNVKYIKLTKNRSKAKQRIEKDVKKESQHGAHIILSILNNNILMVKYRKIQK